MTFRLFYYIKNNVLTYLFFIIQDYCPKTNIRQILNNGIIEYERFLNMELVGQEKKWIILKLLIVIYQLPSKWATLFLLETHGLIFLMEILLDLYTII